MLIYTMPNCSTTNIPRLFSRLWSVLNPFPVSTGIPVPVSLVPIPVSLETYVPVHVPVISVPFLS